ncbi:MAG: sugar-transfer associated ATP-grasp domain-containing protein [Lentimicrobium sp.]
MKKRIIKILVNNRIRRVSKVYDNKINKIVGFEKNVDDTLADLHKAKWAKLSIYPFKNKWLNAFVNSTKIESPDYVPESIFYTQIEPIINSSQLQMAYTDKNFYDLVFLKNIFPDTVLRNINGGFYNENFSPLIINTNSDLQDIILNYPALIIKPAIESGGGENVYLFKRSGNIMIDNTEKVLNLTFLEANLKKNYVVQEVLSQHSDLSRFNKTSINTIRVLTWLSPVSGNVEILQCIFRVGAHGQFVDNSRCGGFAIGISPQGLLNKYATNKIGEHFTEVNGLSLLQHLEIPHFEEIKNRARKIGSKYLQFRLLGLDMAVDDNQTIRCIEINIIGNEINFFQLNNGPLFGEFTNEVIDYCIDNKQQLYGSYIL